MLIRRTMLKLDKRKYEMPALIVGVFVGSLLFQGCGSDTMADAVSRQKDRERESSALLNQDYEEVAGSYDSLGTGGTYLVSAEFEVAGSQRDGFITPQPEISGIFTVKDTSEKDVSALNYSFSGGVYDSVSHKFSATIPGANVPPIKVNCDYDKQGLRMKCKWRPMVAAQSFQFVMMKKSRP